MTGAALLALQGHDEVLDQLVAERKALPERRAVAEARQGIRAVQTEREANGRNAQELSARQGEAEAALGEVEKRLAVVERSLRGSSVPREIEALGHERIDLRARRAELEDTALGCMERVEQLAERDAELVGIEAVLRERLAAAEAALTRAEAELDLREAAAQARRAEAAAGLPAATVARYDRLRARMGGVAVVALDGVRCGGCHLTLPSSEREQLRRSDGTELVTCEQCGRILVVAGA